jgi:glycosyltransferase involved in cell wall biosynthesis
MARWIREAVGSVLAQQDVEIEVIIVDDGSTDGTADVVRALGDSRVRIVPGPRRGISAAMNRGLAEARGMLFARCDADDEYPPGRLAWQVDFLRRNPEFGAVAGAFETLDPAGRVVRSTAAEGPGEEITDELRRGIGRAHLCGFLIRTPLVRELGGFREWFIASEDADFQLRLCEHARVWYEPKLAYRYRLHGSSITHTQPNAQRLFFQRCAEEFQRQRQSGKPDDLDAGTPPPIPQAGEPGQKVARQIQSILLGTAWEQHAAGNKLAALRTGLRACATQPFRWHGWRNLAALALRRSRGARIGPVEGGR